MMIDAYDEIDNNYKLQENLALEKIREHYGQAAEYAKLNEELVELKTAIRNFRVEPCEIYRRELIEELADVHVCLKHVRAMANIDIDELERCIEYKILRTLNRMIDMEREDD